MRKYFDADIDDPLLHDLVMNTDSLPYNMVARMIGDAVLQLFPGK